MWRNNVIVLICGSVAGRIVTAPAHPANGVVASGRCVAFGRVFGLLSVFITAAPRLPPRRARQPADGVGPSPRARNPTGTHPEPPKAANSRTNPAKRKMNKTGHFVLIRGSVANRELNKISRFCSISVADAFEGGGGRPSGRTAGC